MKTTTALLLVLGLGACSLGGCATAYQKAGLTGGYSETRLDEHVARVNFRGNGYTSAERADDFCLLRCAELTIDHGCRFFWILEGDNSVSYTTFTTPTTSYTDGNVVAYGNTASFSATTTTYGGHSFVISKPSTTLLIKCSKEEPDDRDLVLNARYVQFAIRSKYELFKQ